MRVVLDPTVRRVDGGRVLIGGSPLRILRLTEAGSATVDRWAGGAAVGASPGSRRLARRLLDGGLAHPRWDTSPFTAGDVTVVIPAFDRAPELARTLAALADGDPAPGRVIVVDDGSPDPGSLAAAADDAGALLVRRGVNGGPAAARNSGLDEVRTALVAFVDCDVEPDPGWLVPLLGELADPGVGAAAPRIRPSRPISPGAVGGLLARFEQDRSPLDLGTAEARVSPRTRVAYVPTSALLARVDRLREVGGFDEDLLFGEDVDLVWRLVESGVAVRYQPAATVTHPPRPDLPHWLRQRFDYGTSAARLASRHPGALAPVSVSAWSAAAWVLVGAGAPLVGAGVGLAAAVQLPRRLPVLEHPWGEGLRLALGGTWGAWRPLSSAVTRVWWPAAVGAAVMSRRARRAVVAAAVIPPLVDWWGGDRAVDPVRYVVLRLADDVAYGAGVWVGCLAEGNAEPLMPDLHSWPGRRPAVE